MDPGDGRSTGVNETLVAPAAQAPSEAETAFVELYRSSRDDVYAYVAGLLRDRSAAEDVTAQAFERAYRRRKSFNPNRGTRRAWLFGIARNAALDELRRRRRHAKLATEPADDTVVPADEVAEVSLRRTALRQAMTGLTARERELVALKFFAGLTNLEIAVVVGTTESNAGTRLHRVLDKLRRACDDA
ncbi:MAG TPA: sigma-70 family RNA polymerase sigma factor [Solirubrobacterales bacterium]|jgi:RNA polymerase sigma-70 factor, ECF subfamily|nr:sigma-70 family RNA polymerase sigma factor [Solirubrobacterales bacterium]